MGRKNSLKQSVEYQNNCKWKEKDWVKMRKRDRKSERQSERESEKERETPQKLEKVGNIN